MSNIKVEYSDHMGSDLSISNAARVSFNKVGEELTERDAKLIKYLADHKHMTPFRHNQIQIRCEAPIFLVRQLGKHQAGLSWNEVSRRYVKTTPEFYIPDEWRAAPEGSIKQGSSANTITEILDIEGDYSLDIKETYSWAMEGLLELYELMLKNNVAPEMARMVLPQSMMTQWMWTGNLLSFAHVYKERSSEGAQIEAREFAKKLDEVIRPLFPVAWAALVD